MRILFVQKVKALAGSEKYFLHLLPALRERGVDVEFLCISNVAAFASVEPFVLALRERQIVVHWIERKHSLSVTLLLKMRRVIRGARFDAVHSHLIHADFWCALLKAVFRMKFCLLSTKHGYDETYIGEHGFAVEHLQRNSYYRIVRWSEKYINRSFAVSAGLREFFIRALLTKASNVDVIHHGFLNFKPV